MLDLNQNTSDQSDHKRSKSQVTKVTAVVSLRLRPDKRIILHITVTTQPVMVANLRCMATVLTQSMFWLPMKSQNVGYGAITLEWILEPSSGPGAHRM